MNQFSMQFLKLKHFHSRYCQIANVHISPQAVFNGFTPLEKRLAAHQSIFVCQTN